MADYDSLTGLMSRRKSLALAHMEFNESKLHQTDLSVAMLDLDYFKNINDRYGHTTGDQVLQQFGMLCKDVFRKTDIIGRFGGEEFLIVLPQTPVDTARSRLEELLQRMQTITDNINIQTLLISFSAGLCQGRDFNSIEDMISCSDQALYEAKKAGRNQVVMHTG